MHTRPVMVVASAYSLVAIFLFNEPSLFWGGGVSLALLLTGVSGAYRLLPEPAPLGSGLSHDMGVDAVASLVIVAALGVVLWPLR